MSLRQKQIKNLVFTTVAEMTASTMLGGEIAFVVEDSSWYKSDGTTETKTLSGVIQPVISTLDFDVAEPAVPVVGDRYVSELTGTSLVTSTATVAGRIYEWDGAAWIEYTPDEGDITYTKDVNQIISYDGTVWSSGGSSFYTEDGTLSGDRVVSMDNYSITLDGTTAGKDTLLDNDGRNLAIEWQQRSLLIAYGGVPVDLDTAEFMSFRLDLTDLFPGDVIVNAPTGGTFDSDITLRVFCNTLLGRNIVFDPAYVDTTGKPLGTVAMVNGDEVAYQFLKGTGTWMMKGVATSTRVFLDDTTLAPAASGAPTIAEVEAAVSPDTDVLVYYTGTDAAADSPTYVYSVDGAGVATLVLGPPLAALAQAFDSSSGVDAKTLPAALGDGAVLFYVNKDVLSNAATLSPQLGESLNGGVDSTFFASNYADGTQFQLTTRAVGEWNIAVVGTPMGEMMDYVGVTGDSVTAGASFNPAGLADAGSKYDFGDAAVTVNKNDNTILNTVSNEITIGSDGTYSIRFTTAIRSSVGVSQQGNQVVLNGTTVIARSWMETGGSDEEAVYSSEYLGDLTAGDTIDFRWGGSGGTPVSSASSVVLQQLPSTETILSGSVPVKDLHVFNITSGTTANIDVDAVTFRLDLDSNAITPYDPQSLMNTTDNSVVIKQDGVYRIQVSGDSATQYDLQVKKNGVSLQEFVLIDNFGAIELMADLVEGDAITVEFENLISVVVPTALNNGNFSVQQLSRKTVTYVNPEFTEAKNLHTVSKSATLNSFTGVDAAIEFDQTNDNTGGMNTTLTSVTIQQDGKYDVGSVVSFDLDESIANDRFLYIVKNLTAPADDASALAASILVGHSYTSGATLGVKSASVDGTFDLVAGDTLIAYFAAASGNDRVRTAHFNVRQRSLTNYVTPGDVPVTALATGRVDLASNSGLGGSYADLTGMEVTLPSAGKYRVFGQVTSYSDGTTSAGGVQSRLFNVTAGSEVLGSVTTTQGGSNSSYNVGSSNYYEIEVDVLAATTIRLQGRLFGGGATFTIKSEDTFLAFQQLATSTVIRPEDVVVNDQASSGYVDIGTSRITWGKTVGTASAEAVVFPGGGFASTPESIVVTGEGGTSTEVSYELPTAVGVTIRSGVSARPKSWTAFGLHP